MTCWLKLHDIVSQRAVGHRLCGRSSDCLALWELGRSVLLSVCCYYVQKPLPNNRPNLVGQPLEAQPSPHYELDIAMLMQMESEPYGLCLLICDSMTDARFRNRQGW